jgi:multiple sugar transport system permease protein
MKATKAIKRIKVKRRETTDRGVLSNIELSSVGGRIRYYLIVAVLVFLAIIFFFPIYFAFTGGLFNSSEIYKPGIHLWPAVPHWENYINSIVKYNLVRQFTNSLMIVSGGVFFQILVSTLAAYSLARLKPIGGRFVQFGFLLTIMIPAGAYMIPLYRTLVSVPILNISLINSYWGLWLPYSINAFAIVVLKNFFDKLPGELFDAAKVEGASSLDIFLKFILPLSRSIIIVLAILAFVALWKDFFLPYLVLSDSKMQPITVGLWTMARQEPLNSQMAVSAIAMIPPILIALFFQKFMLRGVAIGSVKG